MNALIDGNLPAEIETWAYGAFVALVAVVVAVLAHWIIYAVLKKVANRTSTRVDGAIVRHTRSPARIVFAIIALLLVLPSLGLPQDITVSVQRLLTVALTAAVGWMAINLTQIIDEIVADHLDLTAADNLKAREIYTRVRVLKRVLAAVILVVTVCLILMAIPSIRQIGVTMFASAGVAGIVAGLAARPALSNLIAGIQIAFSQPIRIDDVVIVEGEWGWIEEIRMTFVVVRIWDLRRLVVPLSYFIETPFQNWTRTTADLLGTVFLYADYTLPVEPVREELHRILKTSKLWDGKVWGLQVTNATDKTVELRALMGAHNSSDAWDLRCNVREKLIDFLQREYPDALPRIRAELPSHKDAIGAKGSELN